jgi:hypothetical protein
MHAGKREAESNLRENCTILTHKAESDKEHLQEFKQNKNAGINI